VPDLNADGNVDAFEKNADKFFEIRLTSNPSLTYTVDKDAFLAFNIEVRWPGYTADGNLFTAVDQQSILIVPAAITR
jgi:hypothetical protein